MEDSHPQSGITVTLENEEESWWAYLLDRTGTIIADVWVRNRIGAPESLVRADYVGRPPPATLAFDRAGPFTGRLCASPTTEWSADGQAVSVHVPELGTVVLVSSTRQGWSSNLTRTGPWGQVLDEAAREDLRALGLRL